MIPRCWILTLCLLAVAMSGAAAEPLRYRGPLDQELVYHVTITADLRKVKEVLEGYVVYQVKSSSAPLKISFRGGLVKNVATRNSYSGPPRELLSAFEFLAPLPREATLFAGLSETGNELTVTPTGSIVSLEGRSNLPYLIGNLSLLVFEPLPEADQASWMINSGVLASGKKEPASLAFQPYANDPFILFLQGDKPAETSTGELVRSFYREKEEGALVSFRKILQLVIPGDEVSLRVNGEGIWTFHQELGMPDSLEFVQELTITQPNSTVSIPVGIKYQRLTSEQWARIQSERSAADGPSGAGAQVKAEASAEGVFTAAARSKVLADLAGGDPAQLNTTLRKLAGTPLRPDEELARAVRPWAQDDSGPLREVARRVLASVAPEFKPIYELNREYRGSTPVSTLGLWVSHDTPLTPGLIVAANRSSRPDNAYYPAQVERILEFGLVRVKYFGEGPLTEDRLREDIFLAPLAVDQPDLDEGQRAILKSHHDMVTQSLGSSPREVQLAERLNRAYREARVPLPKMGPPLPEHVMLPKYLVVGAQKANGHWYPAQVSRELPGGLVELRFAGEVVETTLQRSDLRLPPPEVTQPNQEFLPFRVWTDGKGRTVEAKLCGIQGANICLERKSDHREFTVRLDLLSEADRRYVESLQSQDASSALTP